MLLEGKKGLVLNVTNDKSIGWSVAKKLHELGAVVGVGAQNERMRERVNALVAEFPGMRAHTVDFAFDDQLAALAEEAGREYGKLDFVVHSAAFASREALANPFLQTSRADFAASLDVSAYSLVALCRFLEPVLADGASVVAMSYLGSTRAVVGYNVMGVAKAALEASVRYLACDLGARGIRVNTVSPGPINTVAARGVGGLLEMIDYVHQKAPLKGTFGQAEVAGTTAYLVSDLSKGVTGQIVFVDNGYNVAAM